MKRIYSFLTLAVMFFGAALTANADVVEFGFKPESTGNIRIDDDNDLIYSGQTKKVNGVEFSMGDFKYERQRDMGVGYTLFKRMGYWLPKQTYGSMSWSAPGKKLNITKITFKGRVWINNHSSSYYVGHEIDNDHKNEFIKNEVLDMGTWSTVEIENVGDAPIYFHAGGGDLQLFYVKIEYTVVEHSATILTDEYDNQIPHVVFAGAWTSDEINAVIESGTYDNGDCSGDRLGLVDLTDVAAANLGTIETPNPNTIIAIGQNQSIENEANVLVDGNVANLVITDPLTAAGAQDAANYSKVDYGFYYGGEAFTATKASYTRPMSSKYATVMIPFSFDPAAQDATIMDVTNVDESGVEIEPTEKKEIGYNCPFITKVYGDALVITAENTTASGSISTFVKIDKLIGVYEEHTLGTGIYYIAEDNLWNSSSYEGKNEYDKVILKPFRCCFYLPDYYEVKLAIKENATAIKNAQIANEEVPAYNLQGVRVAANAKGFVLMNGKKYFNK